VSYSNNVNAVRDQDTTRLHDDEEGGLNLNYNEGDSCDFLGRNDLHHNVELQLYCDEDQSNINPVYVGIDTDTCTHKIKLAHQEACYKFSLNPLVRWLQKYSNIWGAFLIVLGIVIALFGKPLFKPTICFVGMIVFMGASSLFVFSVFFSRDTPSYAGWIVFGVSLFVGAIVGLILAKLSRLGVAVLAGWGGFCLGMILYSAFMYKLDGDKRILFWIFNISLGIIAGILSIFLFNHAIVISTAIIGSYAFVRGISMYAGGYPNEMELIEIIKYEGLSGIDPRFYGYFAGFIVASILCIVLQYRFWMKDKNHQYKHPYHYRR
jgi:hypothetical protein